jgi:hypothetical protein
MIRYALVIWTLAVVTGLGCGGRESGTRPATGCDDNGAIHPNGTSWLCSDGCNTCSCSNGQLASTLVACKSCGPEGGAAEAGPDANGTCRIVEPSAYDQSDAGTFACGDAACSATEVCIYPLDECTLRIQPRTDAGICPSGTFLFADYGECLGSPNCLRGFSPLCGAPSQCSQQDPGYANIVLALLDAGGDSSRICAARNPP